MDFVNVPKKYRPIPFWSWNEKLDTTETAEHVRVMDEAGIGGFFMHARGGLQTEYMQDEWFDNVTSAVEEAEERGMYPWAYDENGWPSGFGGGVVNGMGIKYQQKYLRMERTYEHTENAICKSGEHWFYYDVNPFYVDTLDSEVIAVFIDKIYKPYYEKYQNRISGFFTDEPQISRNGIPWSFVFEKEYSKRYNKNILEHLEELFLPVGDYKTTRVNFWLMVTELFSESFMKQIYDWCDERNLKFTGHLVCEETLTSQLVTNGACMPHYEYLHIPGMDWLTKRIPECLTAKQLSSVAEQLGKKQVLSETFALCGHDASFSLLKKIYEWQMVRGVNLLCQHLEGYSLRGIRKRDYPPAMFRQQPWWENYKTFNDAVSRIGMIMSEGRKEADVLVIHPQIKAWSLFDCGENKGIAELNREFLRVLSNLEKKHVIYHLGDEIIMKRHARVEGSKIIIGTQSYDTVIVIDDEVMLESTSRILEQFVLMGGNIVSENDIEPNNVTNNVKITYNRCFYDGFTVHYFVNSTEEKQKAKINVSGKKLDVVTGELSEFCGEYEFGIGDSLMIIEDGSSDTAPAINKQYVSVNDDIKLIDISENCITLDMCDYYFDGELQEKNGYVLSIAQRANELGRPVDIHMEYKVKVNYIPDKIHLVCETPQIFDIKVNGKKVTCAPDGYFVDKSFKKLDISELLKIGENVISLDCNFKQSETVYENIKKSRIFESEKNKLSYDMEIEAIYLIGDFAVATPGQWRDYDDNIAIYDGEFTIEAPEMNPDITRLEKSGYPFFCGKMTFEATVNVTGDNPVLKLNTAGINVVEVSNGENKKTALWCNDEINLTSIVQPGENKINITIVNNLRNLLGPHHFNYDSGRGIGPAVFFKEPCVWSPKPEMTWAEGYSFVKTGI